ncbi:MAG: 16S rRNA (guanine(966)-N(2))-methyltransferase RsmD [Pseudomonadota bacterium]
MARQRGRRSPAARQSTGKPPGRLRIVAGNWRSRVLDVADVAGLRPTPERVRETLFNWLGPYIAGAHCLDLFAGTGALGIEALSRGAASCTFVERSRDAARVLERNLELLDAVGAKVVTGDAYERLGRPWNTRFDIVFLDPPFADARLAELCRLLEQASVLAPSALVYIEEPRAGSPAKLPEQWAVEKQKTAGNVRFSLARPAG